MNQENIDQAGGSLLKAIDGLHRDDCVFYWRMVYQDKRFNAELVREINLLMVDASPEIGDNE
jgi:hypothetical protein